MLRIPDKGQFPGTGPNGNGMPVTSRARSSGSPVKTIGCIGCHQIGDAPTRYISNPRWARSTSATPPGCIASRSGQAAENMVRNIGELDTPSGSS